MFPTLESKGDILRILEEITRSRKTILEVCGRLSTRQLHDPVYPGTWSVLQNLQHLAWYEAWMLAWIQKRPHALPRAEWPPEVPLELAAIRTALDEAHAAVIAFLKRHPDAVLREHCQYAGLTHETVGGVLFHLIEHEFHHRAFVAHKLRVLTRQAG
ncbi:MAG: DinB family protein [Gemmataceae bacterium]|nr:DinB family protein [Gemmataceae bacterium]MDW8267506.1 DinB family protein [Gemmataceae bacterium]